VWCAISAQGIIGPYFFEGDDGVAVTVNAERYNYMLENFFLPEMRRRNWNMTRAWFQQDGATAHTTRLSINTLRAAFLGRLLSRLVTFSGPPIHRTLLQLTFLMGVFENSRFTLTLPDINSLKNAIRQEIANVTQDTLRRVMTVYLGDGSNVLIVMEDISKTLYLRREAFCESKTLTYLNVFSCFYCCVNKCVILLSKWVTLNASHVYTIVNNKKNVTPAD